MSKPRKRRKPAGGRASGKAQSWGGRHKHAATTAPDQGLRGCIFLQAELRGGPKRYRVGTLLDDRGGTLPGILVIDNLLNRAFALSMEQAEQWASAFEASEAALIHAWVTTWRAEQMGLRGHA